MKIKHITNLVLFIFGLTQILSIRSEEDHKNNSQKLNRFEDIQNILKDYSINALNKFEENFYNVHYQIRVNYKMEYPLDIIFFIFLGFVLKYILGLFRRRKTFVYNMPDEPDYLSLINNKFKELDSLSKPQSLKDAKDKKTTETTFNQNLNTNKSNIEEKTKNILGKINENINSLVNSINFNCKDNSDVENKINKITGEVENLNAKINKEQTIIDEYLNEITISQNDIIGNIKKNDLNPMTPFSTDPQDFIGE